MSHTDYIRWVVSNASIWFPNDSTVGDRSNTVDTFPEKVKI